MSANRKLLDRYVERYNAGDLDGVMDLYAEDAVQTHARRHLRGPETHPRAPRPGTGRVHGRRPHGGSFVEQGDAFADEWTFVGTHTGPVPLPDGTQLPPTGKRVEIRGMELVQLRDGKIVVNTLYYDNMAVLAQLGLVPEGAIA